jgi:hypothetical protein
MRRIIFLFVGVLVILTLLGLASLLLPSKITVAKSVLINAPKEVIRNELSDFNNWKEWYPAMQDSLAKISIQLDEQNSSVLIIDKSGKKLQLIHEPSIGDTILVKIITSSQSTSDYQFLLMPHGPYSTQVTLNVNTYFRGYPWEKIKGVFLDKISGQYYETVLEQLKKAIERK